MHLFVILQEEKQKNDRPPVATRSLSFYKDKEKKKVHRKQLSMQAKEEDKEGKDYASPRKGSAPQARKRSRGTKDDLFEDNKEGSAVVEDKATTAERNGDLQVPVEGKEGASGQEGKEGEDGEGNEKVHKAENEGKESETAGKGECDSKDSKDDSKADDKGDSKVEGEGKTEARADDSSKEAKTPSKHESKGSRDEGRTKEEQPSAKHESKGSRGEGKGVKEESRNKEDIGSTLKGSRGERKGSKDEGKGEPSEEGKKEEVKVEGKAEAKAGMERTSSGSTGNIRAIIDSNFELLEADPEHVASQLTLIDHELYRAIKKKELIKKRFLNATMSPAFNAMVERFNLVCLSIPYSNP